MAWQRLLSIAVLLAFNAGCSKDAAVGGLVVMMRTDGTLIPEPETLHVAVGPTDGGAPYRAGDFPLDDAATASPGKYALPVSFAIDSNGDPRASVSIVTGVSDSSDSGAIETLSYVVDPIPTDKVVELDVVFSVSSAACEAKASGDGGAGVACCPAECTWTSGTCRCSGLALPTFPADAGETDSGSNRRADAGSPDGTLDSSEDSPDALSDAGPCEAGATQCKDTETPQQCASNGQWTDQPACQAGSTYCFEGSCVSTPTSCVGSDYVGCDSYAVPGGSFLRGDDPLHEDAGAPATISGFRLDSFELTVWRFRVFVDAVVLGTGIPQYAGQGVHSYLSGGKGLNGGGDAGAYETGWDPSWNAMFPTTLATWDTNLSSCTASTWGPMRLGNDGRPINCVTWYEADAFCIWDGGFLPSEAEWNYAAAGGALQRLYPWGSTDPAAGSYAIYGCLYPQPFLCNDPAADNLADFGYDDGRGAFGQWNLAGNVAEWTLDFYAPAYPAPCQDCAELSPATQRIFRGGGFDRDEQSLYTSSRVPSDPSARYQDVGFRCARAP